MAKNYEQIDKYECEECGEEYEEYHEAEECCPNQVIENTYYKCEVCEEEYSDDEENKAKECCADEIKDVLDNLDKE